MESSDDTAFQAADAFHGRPAGMFHLETSIAGSNVNSLRGISAICFRAPIHPRGISSPGQIEWPAAVRQHYTARRISILTETKAPTGTKESHHHLHICKHGLFAAVSPVEGGRASTPGSFRSSPCFRLPVLVVDSETHIHTPVYISIYIQI